MNNSATLLLTAVAGLTSLSVVWFFSSGLRRPPTTRRRTADLTRVDSARDTDESGAASRVVEESESAEDSDGGPKYSAPAYVKKRFEKSEEASILREIAHSLNTPLAQIEASALSIRGVKIEHASKLRQVLDGVGICKAFLVAFREVASLGQDAGAWSPESLHDTLRAAAEIYLVRHGSSANVNIRLSATIRGYANSFVMAIILPLLENAIEAVPSDGHVVVGEQVSDDHILLHVSNDWRIKAPGANIYGAGFTTKDKHDGLGLPTVTRLLALRKGNIQHKLEGGRLIFTVELPGVHE